MPPPTSYGPQQSRGGRPLGTGMQKTGPEVRPLTSNRAAKYGKDQDAMNTTNSVPI